MRRRPRPAHWIVHATVALAVVLWSLPMLGLFITSLRSGEEVAASGWWTSLAPATRQGMVRAEGAWVETGGRFRQQGRVFGAGTGEVLAFGISSKAPAAFVADSTADLPDGGRLGVRKDGSYLLTSDRPPSEAGQRIFFAARTQATLTLQNYRQVLGSGGFLRSLVNSVLVAVPSTLIPMLIAAYAGHALAWLRFPGRRLLVIGLVGLMVVPLQMALIPLLSFHNNIGQAIEVDAKTYIGIWFVHTGFALPLAIHLLHKAMAALPREIIESARLDGLSDHRIFTRIVLPLSFPALAAFGTFQFVWTWNDLLVAMVFLGPQDERLVLTGKLLNLIGSHGGEWEILAASTFVSIALPVAVFLGLQRFLVRGVLAGFSR